MFDTGNLDKLHKKGDNELVNVRKEEMLKEIAEIRKTPKSLRSKNELNEEGIDLTMTNNLLSTEVRTTNSRKRKLSNGSCFTTRILELLETKMTADEKFHQEDLSMRERELVVQESFLLFLKEK